MHGVGFIIGFVVLDFWYVLGHFRFSDTGCVFGTTTDATLSLLCVECIQVSTQVSTSYLLASQLCPQLHGLSLTCHIAPSVSDVITLSHPCIPPPVVFPRLRSRSSAFSHVHYPLSTLISSLSLNHHLYADDTQLFFVILPAQL